MKTKFDVELDRPSDSQMYQDLERYLRVHPNLTRLLFNPAGFVFMAGWIVFVGMVFGWLMLLAVDPHMARNAWAVALVEVSGGRELAVPQGILVLGVPAILVAGISITMDLVTTTWIYPLFYLFRRRNVGRDNFAGYFFQKMEKKAEQHRAFIERYGAIGLFFFMLIPFAINGPMIGAILGKLAGIRTRYILPTVILATVTAVTAWAILWSYAAGPTQEFMDNFHGKELIGGTMLVILAFVIGSTVVAFLRDLRRYRMIRARRDEIRRRSEVEHTLMARDDEEKS